MLPFRLVNCRNSSAFRDGWHRHHIIPRQLAVDAQAGPVLAWVAPYGFSLDDFASNGMLLPATGAIAAASGLPLHTGPHPGYNRRVAAIVVVLGDQHKHPVALLTGLWLVQARLRRLLGTPRAAAEALDRIELSGVLPVHRALIAEIDRLVARFAIFEPCA